MAAPRRSLAAGATWPCVGWPRVAGRRSSRSPGLARPCCPGSACWDTGEFQTVGPLLGTVHPTGFPAYVILGWLASVVLQPFGDPAFRMNLLSAVLVAVAAGVTVVLVRRLTGGAGSGLAAGLSWPSTPIVWQIATHADAHALHLALVAILLGLLVAGSAGGRRRTGDGLDRRGGPLACVAAAVVFGVALANHTLTLLLIPGHRPVRARRRARDPPAPTALPRLRRRRAR